MPYSGFYQTVIQSSKEKINILKLYSQGRNHKDKQLISRPKQLQPDLRIGTQDNQRQKTDRETKQDLNSFNQI